MSAVGISRGQQYMDKPTGEALTVGHASVCFMVPTLWYDDRGRPHQEMLFVHGDNVYRDPKGEAWAASLQSMGASITKSVLAKCEDSFITQVRKALQQLGVKPPTATTDVNVFGDETDREVAAP